jgi:hypothetical protein
MLRVLRPIALADANVVSISEPETEYSAWSSVTAYVVGNRVIYLHYIYESILNGTNKVPGTAAGATYWLLIGPSNYWAALDSAISTQMVSTIVNTLTLTLVATGEFVTAVGVVNAYGTVVRVSATHDGAPVYDETQAINSTAATSFYDYFFGERDLAGQLLFDGIPPYLGLTITVVVSGFDVARLGAVVLGRLYDIGEVQYGAETGIIDYSRKTTDTFGTTTLVEGDYADRVTLDVIVERDDFRRVNQLMKTLRATVCLFVGNDDTDVYGPLVLFGWPRSFRQVVGFPTVTHMALEVEGIT